MGNPNEKGIVVKPLRWLALLLGLAAIVALIVDNGFHQIVGVLTRGGVKLVLVPIVMVIPMIVDAKGWQVLLSRPIPLRRFFYARWIAESVNTLLPAAQVGGLFIKSHILGKVVDEPGLAIASAIVSDTVSAVSLLLFIALTIALMTIQGLDLRILLPLASGALVFCIPVYIFYRLQCGGALKLPPRLEKWASKITAFAGSDSNPVGIRSHLEKIYASNKKILKSLLIQFIGWILGTIEVWMIVHLLGGKISVTEALLLEGLGQTVRNIAFFIPGALGIQEGAYLLVGTMLGLTPTLALSISLVKRFRELAQGIPGLIVWQANEGWSLLRRLYQR